MNSNDLITFENPTLGTLRGFIDEKGEPWFLAAQVCRCLGIKNSAKAISDLRQRMLVVDDWYKNRGITSSYSQKARNITFHEGKNHTQMTVIPEQWLYELIFASRKQTAIVFRAWVTSEVLPELRKYGSYRMEGKLIRRSLTDTIKDSGEDERMHGHGFTNYTILINKSLGLPNKNNRNDFSSEELVQMAKREDLVRCMVAEGKSYQEIKTFLESLPPMRKRIVVKVKTKKEIAND